MPLAVWAEGPDLPGLICFDARLRGEAGETSYPDGPAHGQAGWDVGLPFARLSDLADKLFRKPVALPPHMCGNWIKNCAPIRKGQVTRLAIHVHGLSGRLYVDGQKSLPLTAETVATSHKDLHDIGLATTEDATILFVGCLAGLGKEGTRLLVALSGVWPGRKVAGFGTIGFVSAADMSRPGKNCTEPGMRDTDNLYQTASWDAQQKKYGPLWEDLQKLPWASEQSPHVKVVQNGKVLRGDWF